MDKRVSQLSAQELKARHPRRDELNALEMQKKEALKNNDTVAYNNAQAAILKIIKETRVEMSPNDWDSFSIQEKMMFVRTKMREARVLQNQDDYNYWKSNFEHLKEELLSQNKVKEDKSLQENKEQKKASNETVEKKSPSNQKVQEEKEEIKVIYQPLVNDTSLKKEPLQTPKPSQPTNNQNKKSWGSRENSQAIYEMYKKNPELKNNLDFNLGLMLIIAQSYNPDEPLTQSELTSLAINALWVEDLVIGSIKNENDAANVLIRVQNELNDDLIQKKVKNSVYKDIKEWYDKSLEIGKKEDKQNNKVDLSGQIQQLEQDLKALQSEYHYMLSDGKIDDDELEVLMRKTSEILEKGELLHAEATDNKDRYVISIILNSLEEELKKMKKLSNGLDEIKSTLKF